MNFTARQVWRKNKHEGTYVWLRFQRKRLRAMHSVSCCLVTW